MESGARHMPAFDEGASQEIPFTVGKIEEGIAVLVTDDLQMVEFPSDYLPKDDKPIGVGSVISLRITHGSSLEIARQQEFVTLQNQILQTFEKAPDAKIIGGCFKEISRAHTSIMAEWPSWKALAETGNWKANLDSLDCEVNGTIVFYGIGEGETLVRLTGLEPNQQYKISLIFRTSAGTFRSNFLTTSTCGLDDFSGLYLAIKRGIPETEEVEQLAKEMGVKLELFDADFDKDTITHIICNEASSLSEVVALKASEANIPVVTTSWLKNCKEAGRLQTDNQFSLA